MIISTKEAADINALADEYLRLGYHGLRAKDKSFNSDFNTGFDKSIGKINVVPQDIGRVLLNLFNNAFYACAEQSRSTAAENQRLNLVEAKGGGIALEVGKTSHVYKPVVSVSTNKVGNNIEIKVSDNGKGIPKNVVDKIFQPFFTTKPTGEGTGLGLSLSYDIIKSHNGNFEVETVDSKDMPGSTSAETGTTIIIRLPM